MKKGKPVEQAELLPMKDVTPPKKKAAPMSNAEAKKVVKEMKTEPVETPAAKKATIDPDHRQDRAETTRIKPKAGTAVAIAQPHAPKEAKNVLAIIADAAANPAINPENMRALLDMQKEIMAEQSRRDFSTAFVALQSELPVIRADRKIEIRAKDGKGERTGPVQQSTPYATFPNIMKAIQPLLTKHGFELSFSTEPMEPMIVKGGGANGADSVMNRILVRGFLEGYGHKRETAFPLPAEMSGSKNPIQGWGSSQSYGKRYCAIALLNLVSEAIEDADTDGRHGNFVRSKDGFAEVPDVEKITEDQAIKLRDLIEWCGVGTAKFCSHYGIKTVADLPAEMFAAAEKSCKDYHENQKAKVARG
jgi:hypothetical protein